MSSAGSYGGGGSGMAGVLTITGDTGLTVSGNVTLTGLTSGSGIVFNGTSTTALQTTIDYIAMADAAADGSEGFVGVSGLGTIIAPWGGLSSGNMFISQGAGSPAISGVQNIGIGQQSLAQIIDANNNIAIGFQAAQGCQSLTDNVAIGYQALASNGALGATGVGGNVAIGSNSLRNGTDMVLNIAIGDDAGVNYAATESSNILIGNEGVVSDNNTIRIGTDGSSPGEQDTCYLAGVYNATGTTGTRFVTIDSDFRLAATASGGGGVTSIAGDAGSTATGAVTITGSTSGAVFTESGGNTLTESFLFLALPDTDAIASEGYLSIGGNIIMALYGGFATQNTFIGVHSGNAATSGIQNTALGWNSLLSLTSGTNNTAIGIGSQGSASDGSFNVSLGESTLVANTSGVQNTAIGFAAMSTYNDATANGSNVAVGANSLTGLADGTNNIALGASAGSDLDNNDSSNIIIGNIAVSGDNNTIRIGTDGSGTGEQNACFIAGINGATVTGSAVLCSTAGQLGTVVSSRRYKENIQDIGADSTDVMKLRPVKFSYKKDPYKETQYGLIAEEVHEIMPYLVVYDQHAHPYTIKYHELPTLLLAEIQRLEARLKSLEEQFSARVR